MKIRLSTFFALLVSLPLLAAPPKTDPVKTASETLQWDAESKTALVKFGDAAAAFAFTATNISTHEISINSLHTSCGCTVAQLPVTPYKLAPGSNVTIQVSMNLAGKQGPITKTVIVDSSAGSQSLLVNVNVPTEIKTETK